MSSQNTGHWENDHEYWELSNGDRLLESTAGNFYMKSVISKGDDGEYRVISQQLMDYEGNLLYSVNEKEYMDLVFCASAVASHKFMLNRKKGLLS